MTRVATTSLWLALLLAAPAGAQVRDVTINTESDEGKLLQQAGEQTDPAKKIEILEQFLAKFGSHDAAGWVHLQLQNEYLKVKNFDKSYENGEKALAKAPNDLEIHHFMVKAAEAEGKGDPQRLVAIVEKTRAAAEKVAATPKPADSEEAGNWKRSVDFAAQVQQYNQYALFNVANNQTAPQAKVLLFDALRKNYPGSDYDKQLDAKYVDVYRQLGQNDKMTEAAETALKGEPDNEAFLYITGESYLDPAKGKLAQAQANAEKIISTLPNKPKPSGVDDDAWAKHKSTYMGLGNSLAGRALASQGKYGPATKYLLAAAKDLKGNNDALAPVYYYLGFCNVKLNRTNDALSYLGQAAKIPGPFQAPANDLLGKVRAAVSGR